MPRPARVAGVLIAVFSLFFLGCQKRATPPATTATTATPAVPANALAAVNGQVVTGEEFSSVKTSILNYYRQIYTQFGLDIQQFLTGARGRMFLLDMEVAALETLVSQALVKVEAARRGVTPSEEEVAAEFGKQYAQFLQAQGLNEETLSVLLQLRGSNLSDFKASARKQVADGLLYQKVAQAVAAPLTSTEADLLKFFEENMAKYATEEQVEASHILVQTGDEANKILEQLKAGAQFGELARLYSQDPGSAAAGGALGWFGRGMMVPEFEEAAFALKVGQVSNVVKTQFGYHIILVTGRREARQPPYAEVAEQVKADYEQKVRGERFEAWLRQAKDTAQVKVYDPLLEAAYTKERNLDRALALFEEIRKAGKTEEKYLAFIVGTVYEQKLEEARKEREELQKEPESPARAARLAELDKTIANARTQAIAAYREALASAPDDQGIKLRLENLESSP